MAWAGCATDTPTVATEPRTLVDHSAWAQAPLPDDPWASHQPASIACGIAGWYVEYDVLEIDTARCNYAWIEHPALVAVPVGHTVTTVFSHFDLQAPEPAEAHAAILFGNEVQWETTVAIPQPGDVTALSWQATTALSAGDPIRIHLHNHGQNFWSLDRLIAHVPIER